MASVRSGTDAELVRSFTVTKNSPKPSAHLGFGSEDRGGVVSLWDTGELEAEVMVFDSLTRPIFMSTVIQSADELRAVLDDVLAEMRKG